MRSQSWRLLRYSLNGIVAAFSLWGGPDIGQWRHLEASFSIYYFTHTYRQFLLSPPQTWAGWTVAQDVEEPVTWAEGEQCIDSWSPSSWIASFSIFVALWPGPTSSWDPPRTHQTPRSGTCRHHKYIHLNSIRHNLDFLLALFYKIRLTDSIMTKSFDPGKNHSVYCLVLADFL